MSRSAEARHAILVAPVVCLSASMMMKRSRHLNGAGGIPSDTMSAPPWRHSRSRELRAHPVGDGVTTLTDDVRWILSREEWSRPITTRSITAPLPAPLASAAARRIRPRWPQPAALGSLNLEILPPAGWCRRASGFPPLSTPIFSANVDAPQHRPITPPGYAR